MKKIFYLLLLTVVFSCGSPQSKWTPEQAKKYLSTCFEGIDGTGSKQSTCFDANGTWEVSSQWNYGGGGGYVTTDKNKGTWEVDHFDKQYDWWVIKINHGETTTTLSTMNGHALYMGGFKDVYHGTTEYKEEE